MIHRKYLKPTLLVIASTTILLIGQSIFSANYQIGINLTDSLPGTFFLIEKDNVDLKQGDLVSFRNKNTILYPNKNLLKIITGKPGDYITIDPQLRSYQINQYKFIAKEFSKTGKKLEFFQFKKNIIPDNKYFVTTPAKDSYDSRYFGFIDKSQIIGKAWAIF
jgi:signal peptidase I